MLNKILLPAALAALVALLMPSVLNAYGAAHVGYTHVGPNGVYHQGATAAVGPGGAYAGGRTTAVGASGGAYHAEYGRTASGGVAAGGYHYDYRYSGGAATTARYGYVR